MEASEDILQCCFNITESLQEQYQSIKERRNFIISTKASLESINGRIYLDMDNEVLIAIFDQLIESTITGGIKLISMLQYPSLFPKVKCNDCKCFPSLIANFLYTFVRSAKVSSTPLGSLQLTLRSSILCIALHT